MKFIQRDKIHPDHNPKSPILGKHTTSVQTRLESPKAPNHMNALRLLAKRTRKSLVQGHHACYRENNCSVRHESQSSEYASKIPVHLRRTLKLYAPYAPEGTSSLNRPSEDKLPLSTTLASFSPILSSLSLSPPCRARLTLLQGCFPGFSGLPPY